MTLFNSSNTQQANICTFGVKHQSNILVYTESWVSNQMPNKRHPTRKYIGFWGTVFLKEKLKKIALKRGVPLSGLVTKVLWDFVNETKFLVLFFSDF